MSRAADLASVGAGIASSANATAISISATEVVTLLTSALATSEGGAVTTNIAQGLIKAWNRLDGDASTLATNDSFGISGIVDVGTGRYTSTFTNAMSNAHYSISISGDIGGSGLTMGLAKGTSDASKVNTVTYNLSSGFADMDPAMLLVAGDLA
tara:strand:+ start:568 stop:1029 length:462 start_codon:yes stop_codon:yes gene_type:complete